jgi:eukaryotic-like serine/threonine-protein kinase
MLDIGSTIAGWQIVRELHQGSMAVTFEVRRPDLDGRYALKLMYLRDPSFQERLRRVGEAQKGLSHPHLIDVVDVIDFEGAPGIVSRYVEGTDLSTWAAAEQRPLPQVIEVFRQLVDGLVTAHERGLIHRNLKPQKVLIDANGVPHLHDFMLGKTLSAESKVAVTQMGTTFGTPQYMSPEQFRGAADVDARTDLFSLGSLLFELVTGRRAFDGKGLMDIYKQVSASDYPAPSSLRPDVPPELDALVANLLAVERDDRPPSARVVAERLDHDPVFRALRGLAPLYAPPPPSTTTPPPPPRAVRPAGMTLMPESIDFGDLDELADDDDTDIRPQDILAGSGDASSPRPRRSGGRHALTPLGIDRFDSFDPGESSDLSPVVPPPPLGPDTRAWMGVLAVLLGAIVIAASLLCGGAWIS